jgi:hypothetical protein
MGGKYERVIELARQIDKSLYDGSTAAPDLDDLSDELHALLADLPEDEPIFVLRAQDRVAPMAVRSWIMYAERCGADDPTVSSGVRTETHMILWQENNPLRVKVPTTPPVETG